MDQKPMIVIRKFYEEYNADGTVKNEWVEFSPAHDPIGTVNVERVKNLIPPESGFKNDDQGTKLGLMAMRWAQIEPHYKAWKSGQEIPLDGTPLAAWSGVSPQQAEVLKARGIKTVEAVRDMSEGILSKVQLPNVRSLRDVARAFLENKESSDMAAKMAKKDEEAAAMKAQLDEMASMLAELTKPQSNKPILTAKAKEAA
jgi:hypothetical protein